MQAKCRQVNALFWYLHIIKNLMVDETGFKLEEPKVDETAVDELGPHLWHNKKCVLTSFFIIK